jgi:TRAP-type uncharacterized transport system substrate-binding protein
MAKIPAPQLGRSITLSFMGDWGRANLHRALGWLGYEMLSLTGPHTKYAIWNGRGGLDNIQAVGRGQVDAALAVPVPFVRMAVEGKGRCAGETFPHVRALGYVPQDDRMVVGIRKELGIRSFAELREKKPKLRIAAGPDDGISFMGVAAQMLMEAHGIPRAEFERWGGRYVEHEEPRQCTRAMLDGSADAIIQEAVMTQYWHDMTDKVELSFLPVEPQARDSLARDFHLPSAPLPRNYFRGMTSETLCLDFSHFLFITTTDLPDDIAYALAWCLVERWETLEQQYRHIPPERSPVTYPIDPKAVCRTPIALHPGAERYYREAGHLA